MAKKYSWPKRGTTSLIGKPTDRIDGLAKATGAAKYTYDVNFDKQLVARVLGCPHAHCKIKSIDLSAAEKVPGVVKAVAMKVEGNEVRWEGDPIAAVAGESEGAVAEGLTRITCIGEGDIQQWEVHASTQGKATFQDGAATAVAIGRTTLRGATTDAHQWLVDITLVEE